MRSLSSSADNVRPEELIAATPTSTRSSKFATILGSSTHRRPLRLYQAENVRTSSPEPEEEGMTFRGDPVRHGQATTFAQLVIDVGMRPTVDEPDGPFEPEVIRRVLPDDQAGTVEWVVGCGLRPPRLETTEYTDAGREIAADAADDARGVHRQLGDFGAQDMGRPGHLDLQPVVFAVERDVAIPPRVDDTDPSRGTSYELGSSSGAAAAVVPTADQITKNRQDRRNIEEPPLLARHPIVTRRRSG